MRRLLTISAVGLVLAALIVAALGFFKVHQTNVTAQHDKRVLNQQVDRSTRRQTAGPVCAEPSARPGEPFARIRVPSIGLSLPVIYGTAEAQLNTGAAGRVTGTYGMPGHGNLSLAAHVVSAGNPFLRLHDLKRGAVVFVYSRCGSFTYKVTSVRVVQQSDVSVLRQTPQPRLTLITCYPATYVSTPYRTVVVAQLLR